MTEIIITPQSSFHKKTIRELQFRKKYGCTVLALHRNGTYIQTDVGKEGLKHGDALIINGEWEKIEFLADISKDLNVDVRFSESPNNDNALYKYRIVDVNILPGTGH